MTDPAVLADYEGWLYATAVRLGTREQKDDLAQEGRVAMWRALQTFDATRGSLPSWLTRAALQRMQDVAWGHGQPFGHEAVRGSRPVDVVGSIDAEPEEVQEALLGYVEDAYHDGEVMDAIRRLPLAQQQYVFIRFWGGLEANNQYHRPLLAQFPQVAEKGLWAKAKAALREDLSDREGHTRRAA